MCTVASIRSQQSAVSRTKEMVYLSVSLLLVICLAIPLSAQAQNLLDEPQKIVVDAEHDRLLVSNFGNGAIVQIDNENNQSYFIENAGFVDGLEIVGNTIYGVGHSRKLYAYNLDTREQVLDFHFSGLDSNYLSSVTSDSAGHLFISCPALHTIYKFRISDNSYGVFAQGNGLNRPNGILLEIENNRIVVIDDSPDASIIHAISLSDATVTTLATTSFDRPDGVVRDAFGAYYIGGYYLPGLYKIDADFSEEPEMFFAGSHMVYPTYDPRDHSLLITYYGSDGWDWIMLETGTNEDKSVPKNLELPSVGKAKVILPEKQDY